MCGGANGLRCRWAILHRGGTDLAAGVFADDPGPTGAPEVEAAFAEKENPWAFRQRRIFLTARSLLRA